MFLLTHTHAHIHIECLNLNIKRRQIYRSVSEDIVGIILHVSAEGSKRGNDDG